MTLRGLNWVSRHVLASDSGVFPGVSRALVSWLSAQLLRQAAAAPPQAIAPNPAIVLSWPLMVSQVPSGEVHHTCDGAGAGVNDEQAVQAPALYSAWLS